MASSIFSLVLAAIVGFDGTVKSHALEAATKQGTELMQTYERALNGEDDQGRSSPVTRVIKLLEAMSQTTKKEMDDDEKQYDKLSCWCNNNEYAKEGAISDATAKVAELEASIESLTSKLGELSTTIAELRKELDADRTALKEAVTLRENQKKEFHKNKIEATQNIQSLKAAVGVLGKKGSASFLADRELAADPEEIAGEPGQMDSEEISGGLEGSAPADDVDISRSDTNLVLPAAQEDDQLDQSFLALRTRKRRSDDFWNPEAQLAHQGRALDNFMRTSGLDDLPAATDSVLDNSLLQSPREHADKSTAGSVSANGGSWSIDDEDLVKNALRIGNAFLQARNEQGYYPNYNAQSGEIVGILKQMLDEMQSNLADSEKKEKADASAFEELRAAKAEEIASAEKMEEEKEDDLATSENALAQAKKDLKLMTSELQEAQAFKKELGTTCADAETSFQARKAGRLEELKALGETIEILSADEAKDAMKSTYSFLQRSTTTFHSALRRKAAAKLHAAARRSGDSQMSVLATAVELDAFGKVKKAIDEMIVDLNQQMKDEVVKVDHCKSELQKNELMTAKAKDKVDDLTAKSQELSTQVKTLKGDLAKAKAAIAQLQSSEQGAGQDRLAESIAFQKLVVDQTLTIQVMNKAIDRLNQFYSKKASLLQLSKGTGKGADGQSQPAQFDYSPNQAGASGVVELLKTLIQQVQGMIANARKEENKSQANYRAIVEDTNAEIDGLQKQVTNKKRAKVAATKDERDTDSDIEDLNKDLAGLANLNGQLHADCDYVLKNFDIRQKARSDEINALEQAKQILNGASS